MKNRTTRKPDRQPFGEVQIDTVLSKQLDILVGRTFEALIGRGRMESKEAKKNERYLRKFLTKLIGERNSRADEVITPEVQEANRIISQLLPHPVYAQLCTDGRIFGPALFGIPASAEGGTIKFAAAETPGFRRNKKGELYLHEGSAFEKKLRQYFEEHRGEGKPMYQVHDSHVGCAARGKLEKTKGKVPDDGGLLKDVLRKQEIGQAMKRYVDSHFPQIPGRPAEKLVPVQFSFDPYNGFGYMGLETAPALQTAKQIGGFTEEVRENLAQDGAIISTALLAGELKDAFEKYAFDADWTHDYVSTASNFWKGMKKIVGNEEVFRKVQRKVKKIYGDSIDREELTERTILVLANTFNGFLQNYGKDYPYKIHVERCIVIEERSNGPFETVPFLLFPESENLAGDILLTQDIVRNNRYNPDTGDHSISDITRAFAEEDRQGYREAPVSVVIKSIIRDEVPENEWEEIRKVNWKELTDTWMEMPTEELRGWLKAKTHIQDEHGERELSDPVLDGVCNLHRLMLQIYSDEDTYKLFSGGSDFALPALVDKNRKIMAVIPLAVI